MAKKVVRMQKRKLLELATMLEKDAKNKKGIQFDMDVVGKPSDAVDPIDTIFFAPNQIVPLDCGTTACAMGLAALSGKFKKEGLSYRIRPAGEMIDPKWKGRVQDYDKVAMKLFGITIEQANYLFSPWTYPYSKKKGAKGEREVVRRIKWIVAGKKIPNKSLTLPY